jgi:hypothetical protein
MAELYFSLIHLHGVVLKVQGEYVAVKTTIKINKWNSSYWFYLIVAM